MPTIDLDAFRREQKAEPVTVRLPGGREINLPPGLPADVALDVIRLQRDQGPKASLNPGELMGLATQILGPQSAEITVALSLDELGELLKQLLELYAPGGPAPKAAAPRRRSRPVSRS